MSLSSLLVQRELATIRDVEEALARQVLYGGDLATNLLEVARLDERPLGALLAESFGLPAAAPFELAASSPEARAFHCLPEDPALYALDRLPQWVSARRALLAQKLVGLIADVNEPVGSIPEPA